MSKTNGSTPQPEIEGTVLEELRTAGADPWKQAQEQSPEGGVDRLISPKIELYEPQIRAIAGYAVSLQHKQYRHLDIHPIIQSGKVESIGVYADVPIQSSITLQVLKEAQQQNPQLFENPEGIDMASLSFVHQFIFNHEILKVYIWHFLKAFEPINIIFQPHETGLCAGVFVPSKTLIKLG